MGKIKSIVIFSLLIASIAVIVFGQHRWSNMNSNFKSRTIEAASSPKKKEVNYYKEGRGELKYVAIGDSLTAGLFADKEDERFCNVLSTKISEEMGYDVKLEKIGTPGGTLGGGLDSLSVINKSKPDFVSIEFGTNDLNNENNVPVETFKSQLNELIDGIQEGRKEEVKFVLVTTWNQGKKGLEFDKAIKEVGDDRKIPVANIATIWNNSSTKGPEGRETFIGLSDNWHPNTKGHKLIAEKIYLAARDELNL